MKRQLSLASIATLLLLLMVSVTAQGGNAENVPSSRSADYLMRLLGPGTVVLDTSKNPLHQLFTDGRLVRNTGSRQNGNCSSEVPLKLSRGEAPVALLVVAANPRTCQQVLEVGHLKGTPSFTGGTSATSVTAAPSRLSPAAATGGTQPAHFITVWFDPAAFPVNHMEDIIYWSYGGGRVSNCRGSDYRWWLSDTGWRETAHSGPYYVYENNSSQCRLYTTGTFFNPSFHLPGCQGNTGTGIGYNANNVYGKSNGDAWGWVNTWVWGGCANFLHYSTYLEWG